MGEVGRSHADVALKLEGRKQREVGWLGEGVGWVGLQRPCTSLNGAAGGGLSSLQVPPGG